MRWASCMLAIVMLPALVRLDDFHFQNFPVGQRSLGMGGAATALGEDPSAAFYNPAGIGNVGSATLSASLTLTAFD